jgi:hypothetical protein
MAINLIEAIYLLKELGVEEVKVDRLIETFLKQPEAAEQIPAEELNEQLKEEDMQPPLPPEFEETTYKTYAEAKKAAKKGQKPVKEGEGYILV